MMEASDWPLKSFQDILISMRTANSQLTSYLCRNVEFPSTRRFLALGFVDENKRMGRRFSFSDFMDPLEFDRRRKWFRYQTPRVLVGFAIADWEPEKGAILLTCQALRTANSRVNLDRDLLGLLVKKCVEERQDPKSLSLQTMPPISHIWTHVRKKQKRFFKLLSRLGFVDRSTYIEESHCGHELEAIHAGLNALQQEAYAELFMSVNGFDNLIKCHMSIEELTVWQTQSVFEYMEWRRSSSHK